ncbi:hypothetical protein [Serratia bockelmannii]|uniref:hypothetical protein n=1 Tax=Serratia bockelmannii TaxID=2703793 RepID=UPI003FA7B62C
MYKNRERSKERSKKKDENEFVNHDLATSNINTKRVSPPVLQRKSNLTTLETELTTAHDTPNIIDIQTSSNLSSDNEIDFIWAPSVDTSKLQKVPGYYSPTIGSAALFLHAQGTESLTPEQTFNPQLIKMLLIKGQPFPPTAIARNIQHLNGYDIQKEKPLILASCCAGYGEKGSVAQSFADFLQRRIIASTGLVHIATNEDKTTILSIYSDYPFEVFNPLPLYFPTQNNHNK